MLLSTLAGGGGEGTPSQVWLGGYPIPGLAGGDTPSQVWPMGVLHPKYPFPSDLGQGPPKTWDGVPPQTLDRVPPRPGMGYPPRPGTGYPTWTWDQVPPSPPDLGLGTPQHSEFLISGGRYASCVDAGGLSCLQILVAKQI